VRATNQAAASEITRPWSFDGDGTRPAASGIELNHCHHADTGDVGRLRAAAGSTLPAVGRCALVECSLSQAPLLGLGNVPPAAAVLEGQGTEQGFRLPHRLRVATEDHETSSAVGLRELRSLGGMTNAEQPLACPVPACNAELVVATTREAVDLDGNVWELVTCPAHPTRQWALKPGGHLDDLLLTTQEIRIRE
jgi:hypothetical protein